jgi:hypothetical protein
MSDETTDPPSEWDIKGVVGVLTLIVVLGILTVAIYDATCTDDDDTENPNYLDTSLYSLKEYGGTIYFGPSHGINVPAKSTFQVKDGILRVSYWTKITSYDSEGYYVYNYLHTYYGTIDQITYISINTHR